MRRTNDFTGIRGLLVALMGIVLMLAGPALAEARGGAQGTQAGPRLIASGTGYATPHGSARVRAVQHRLTRAGEGPGPIDGLYGPLTQAAVERFQAGEGLNVDGIVGPATSSALNRQTVVVSDGAGYADPDGSTRVRGLQHRLRRAGEHPGPLDGRFGPRTQAAVERFQAGEGLTVDGIIGTATSARLARFAATSDRTSASNPQQAGRPPVKPREAPNPHSTPDHAGAPAPTHAAAPSPVRDHGGSEFPTWIVGLVGLGIALLFGGAAARATARRDDEKKPGPVENKPDRSFQVRFDGRDSQGVMAAAELLSVAALVEGRDALAFPSFRSGPAGPRVVAFCRIGGPPVRPRQSIGRPDGLIVQDPEVPQLRELCEALEPGGYLLVNSSRSIEELDLGNRGRHVASRPADQHSGERDRARAHRNAPAGRCADRRVRGAQRVRDARGGRQLDPGAIPGGDRRQGRRRRRGRFPVRQERGASDRPKEHFEQARGSGPRSRNEGVSDEPST